MVIRLVYLLFKDVAPTYTNNVSVSGGTDKLKFFASVGAYNQKGIIDKTSYDKYNFRSNMDAKITDNFDLSLGLSGYVSTDSEPGLVPVRVLMLLFSSRLCCLTLTCALNTTVFLSVA